MSSTPPGASASQKDLSNFELSLIEKTETAIREGRELERWTRDPNRKVEFHLLDLNRPYKLPNTARGYFGEVTIGGRTLTSLGSRQEVEFGTITGPDPEQRLKNYVLRDFLNTSRWNYPDGRPGGFSFKQMLYCDAQGICGRYAENELTQVQDWNLIGTKYRWSLFTCYLHDFVFKMGPVSKVLDEAVAVVQHPDFIHVVENPSSDYKLEVAIGYPFIDFAPIPNYFGFGPGKFNWAVKTYSFRLRHNNQVQVVMDFVAGSRPKKVFDFGKHIPDPFYGTADLLGALSLGLFPSRAIHDFMDLEMAAQHSRVHQALMEGASQKFAELQK